MLPAFLANMAPAIITHISGTGKPLDGGKYIGNNRILGDGKTIRGLIAGIITGITMALIQNMLAEYLNMPLFSIIAMITLPLGTLSGDIAGSFIKRRINIERGKALPLVDQLDFVTGAWLFTLIFDYKWFINYFTLPIIIAIIIITPLFHWLFNIIGYKLGVCKEPW